MWVLIALLVVVGVFCLDALMKISQYLRFFLRWPSSLPKSNISHVFDIFVSSDKFKEDDVYYYIKSAGLRRCVDFFCIAKCDDEYYVTDLCVRASEVGFSGGKNYIASVRFGGGRLSVFIECSDKSFDCLVGLIGKRQPVSLRFRAGQDKNDDFVTNDILIHNDCGKYFLSNFKEYLTNASQDDVNRLSDFGKPEFLKRYDNEN